MAFIKFEFMVTPNNYGAFSKAYILHALINEISDRISQDEVYINISAKYKESAVILCPYNAFLTVSNGKMLVCITNVNANLSFRSLNTNTQFPMESGLTEEVAMGTLAFAMNGALAPIQSVFDLNSICLFIDLRLLDLYISSQSREQMLSESVLGYITREKNRMSKTIDSESEGLFGKPIKIQKDYVFVIMPFSPGLDDVYQLALKQVLKSEPFNMHIERADEIYKTGHIMRQIWESISKARFIIADMTGRNPNVMYELGIAHTLGKEVVMITQEINDIPFDLRHLRHAEYSMTTSAFEKLKTDIARYADSIINNNQQISS